MIVLVLAIFIIESLFLSTHEILIFMTEYKFETHFFFSNLNMPQNFEGNISYIAVNRENKKELSFATDLLNVYISSDSGKTWEEIVEEGTSRKSG